MVDSTVGFHVKQMQVKDFDLMQTEMVKIHVH